MKISNSSGFRLAGIAAVSLMMLAFGVGAPIAAASSGPTADDTSDVSVLDDDDDDCDKVILPIVGEVAELCRNSCDACGAAMPITAPGSCDCTTPFI